PSLQPTPAHLLRFALRGTTVANKPNPAPAMLPFRLKRVFNTDWSSDAAAPPTFWKQKQRMYQKATEERFLYGLMFKAQSVPHLQVFIQRHVYSEQGALLLQENGCTLLAIALEHCQRNNSYQEILVTLNAIIMRIENLGVEVRRSLRALAIHYSSLAFSAAAMRPHLKEFSKLDQTLKGKHSAALMNSLSFSLDALETPELQHEIESMRRLISPIHMTEVHESHHLDRLLHWNGFMESRRREVYMPLLAKLGMYELLDSVWERVKDDLLSERNLEPIYRCVFEMMKDGMTSKALVYLKQLSSMLGGKLPHISKVNYLSSLLDDEAMGEALPRLAGEEERLSILEAQLQTLERRLGICWEPEKSVHVGFSNPDCNTSENPLFDIDGETPGYDSSERLVADVMALGCSKSTQDLRHIANLLDDYEGQMVPISTPNEMLDFAWCIERSPIEICGTSTTLQNDLPQSLPVESLGLLRIRLDGNQISPAHQYPLRFIHLGRLLKRLKWQEPPECNRKNRIYDWEQTGYIVGWDRVHARFVLVY
ncbi:hypothetical protein P170DRAFT_328215, partial [Aspergillus steynii IBT 23096]